MSTAIAEQSEVDNQEPEFFVNSRGFKVPKEQMAPQDILKNEMVMKHIARAKELSKMHDEFKRQVFSDVQDFIALLADHYDVEVKQGKGNVTLTSFDGKSQIKVAIDDVITFGPEIDLAKQLINEVAEELLGDKEDDQLLNAIITDAFQADKEGNYNKSRILSLRRYRNYSDMEKWKQAMEALDDGIIAGSTKTYIRFSQRNEYGASVPIALASKSL